MKRETARLWGIVLGAAFSISCRTEEGEQVRKEKAAAAEAAAAALTDIKKDPKAAAIKEVGAKAGSETKPTEAELALEGSRFLLGPQLVAAPGKGLGPIRFGASFETIERHMGLPCDEQTEERCLYVRHALEFFMKDGVVVGMKAYRRGRDVSRPPGDKDKKFGSFRGFVPPKIKLGLHRHIVLEEFGEPLRKEALEKSGASALVERHYYDGLVFEYDKIKNGNIVLSAIEITPSKTAPPAGPKAQKKAAEPGGQKKALKK